MHPFPHEYTASASARPEGRVTVASPGLSEIATSSPAQFGGPGDVWSPETLLCASLADCFVLTFRAVATASSFEWQTLECRVEGVLERVDRVTRFTRFTTYATLGVAAGSDTDRARLLLEKAEHGCLVSNSVSGARSLVAKVETVAGGSPSS